MIEEKSVNSDTPEITQTETSDNKKSDLKVSPFKTYVEEIINSSQHLSKRHVHPRMQKMFEMGGMNAVFTRADGQYLWDSDGNRFLDLLSGGGVFILGRNNKSINEAIRSTLELDIPNLSIVNASILGGALAEQLLELAGPSFSKVLFGNSGTESTDLCARFARVVTRRRRFLYMEGGFHGRTYAAASLCGWDEMKEGMQPFMPTTTPIQPNNIAQLKRELSMGDVAAVFVEPIQGMTGTVMTPDYLREMENLCARYGTLMVADEVQTGLGRGGSWFRTVEYGVRPSMITVSKILSGGQVPVSAVLLSQEVYDTVYAKFQSGPNYFSTFAENNLAMTAGLATLKELKRINAPKCAREISAKLRAGVEEIGTRYDVIDHVRGDGLMLAIYFRDSESLGLKIQQQIMGFADKASFGAAVNVDLYKNHRIIVQVPGPGTNAIKILPPAILTDEDINYFLGALEDTIASFYDARTGPIASISKGFFASAAKSIKKVIPEGMLPAALAEKTEKKN